MGLLVASLIVVFLVILVVTILVMVRASKGYDKAKARRKAAGEDTVQCTTCRSWMVFAGIQEFSTGRISADIGSAPLQDLPLEVYRCPTCRKIELFLPPSAG